MRIYQEILAMEIPLDLATHGTFTKSDNIMSYKASYYA